jgi:hypothetical protein
MVLERPLTFVLVQNPGASRPGLQPESLSARYCTENVAVELVELTK